MNHHLKLFLAVAFLGTGLARPSAAQVASVAQPVSAMVPALPGWYNGRPVVYLATDASDKAVAKGYGANYVP